MLTVTDRAELTGRFRPQSLTAQAGSDGFDIVFRQFFGETRRTITLLCLSECPTDSSITDEPELLAWTGLMVTLAPAIPAATGNPKHTAHGFDAELSPMFFDKDILHFRRFAKYVAAFWRIANSSSRSASCRLRRAFSTDISCSRSEDE
ncbi:hypothetical protein D3C76_1369970 [compost metagenome]